MTGVSDERSATAGTGWAEAYMGGSAEAERGLFAEIMPRVERMNRARIQAYERSADHRRDSPGI